MDCRLLISDSRLAHMRNVGRRAQLIARRLGIEAPEEQKDIFLMGYLHDVGYEFSNNQAEHERIGGRLLEHNGYRYWQEIYHHGNPDAEYSSTLLDILNAADMLTNAKGESVTFEERLSDIASRYGNTSQQHAKAKKLVGILIDRGYSFASEDVLSERLERKLMQDGN